MSRARSTKPRPSPTNAPGPLSSAHGQWPADAVERRKTASLIPYAKNARTHSEEQVLEIARSITEWGWTVPVLVDEASNIIAGHGRVMAAQKLGIAEVPVMVARGWSEAKRRAYILADNQLALNGGWDESLLRLELGELKGLGLDLGLIGFRGDELAALFADKTAGLTDPDDAPELPKDPVSRVGDLWTLGSHRLLCGDSTNAEHVARLLGDARPHLMITDPPYGVSYNPAWRNEAYRAGPMKRTIGAKAVGKVNNDDRADWTAAWALAPTDVCYVWQGDKQISDMEAQLNEAGFVTRNLIVWNKSIGVISRGDYHPKHETCWYMVRKGKTGRWEGDRKQTTVWDIAKPHTSETGHSTQKPTECMRRPIVNNSAPGDSVYDPFLGSGTTLIAAEMEGRKCYGLEIDPGYCDVIVERWQNFHGTKGDGRPWVRTQRLCQAAFAFIGGGAGTGTQSSDDRREAKAAPRQPDGQERDSEANAHPHAQAAQDGRGDGWLRVAARRYRAGGRDHGQDAAQALSAGTPARHRGREHRGRAEPAPHGHGQGQGGSDVRDLLGQDPTRLARAAAPDRTHRQGRGAPDRPHEAQRCRT